MAADCGFLVPESLLTNDAPAALAFAARCGEAVYKGAGGSRTITGLLDPADSGRLAHLATCPAYLQRRIAGRNVRVHVAGDAVFAVEIEPALDDLEPWAASSFDEIVLATDLDILTDDDYAALVEAITA